MKALSPIDPPKAQSASTAYSPMKVCMHVLSRSLPDVRVMRSATALVKEGFSVSIIDIESERTCPIKEEIGGIQIYHLIEPSWFTARNFELWFFMKCVQIFIRSILRLLRTPADVYHANDLKALPACYIAARLRRKPLIFELYDLQFPVPETSVGFWRHLGKLLTPILAVILPHCAGVIATSPLHARELCKRYHLTEISLIRSVLTYRTVKKSDCLRQHLGLGPDVHIALYQGNIQPDRGLEKLVFASAFLEPNVVIVIMGKGMGSTQTQLEALIASEGVADRIKIIPPVPYEELLDWTASADIGLLVHSPDYSLNVRTMLPNKVFEYLMAGLPVLSSPLGAVVDVIRTYDVGQVMTSLAPEDIGTAINAMLADQEMLERLSRNALQASREELNWDKEMLLLLALYQKVCSSRG